MEISASILPLISEVCDFQFSEYMENFDYVRLSMRMDEFNNYALQMTITGHIIKS